MNLGKLGWSCLVLGLMGCPPVQPATECGTETCAAGQRCDAAALKCVADVANALPVIEVLAPSTTVSTATFTVTGKITDDVAVTASEWSVGSGSFAPIVLAADGTFSFTVDAPQVDSQQVVVSLRARDAAGEAAAEARVVVDRVGPTINFVSPSANQLIAAQSVTADVQVADLGAVAGVSFSFDGAPVAGADRGSGRWTVEIPTAAEEQERLITVQATDAAGNVSNAERTVRIDRLAPTISVTAPAANSVQGASAAFAVTTSADVESVVAAFGGREATLTGSSTAWSGSLSLVPLDSVAVMVRVTARDFAGNSTFVDHPLTVDNVGPTITVTAPLANSFHRSSIAVTVTTAGAAAATATLAGQTVALTGGPNAWTGSVPVPAGDLSSSSLQITATDLAGNTSSSSLTLYLDTVAPVISFTSPAEGQKFNAAALAGNPNVTSTWTLTDGDPQAAITTINGNPSTALTISMATAPTDNGRTYIPTVYAIDRAGNEGVASVTYAVDRVAPTIVAWTPAAESRNVDPLESTVTFSEPVFGAQASTDGLLVRFMPQPTGGQWSPYHQFFGLPLSAYAGRVVTVGFESGLTDAFGNPFIPPVDRRFHLVETIASGSLLLSNVTTFAATSDADGAVSIASIRGSFLEFHRLGQNGVGISSTHVGSRVSLNDWSTVDPGTLRTSHRNGISLFNAAAPAGSQYRHFIVDQNVLTELPGTTAGAVISAPPLANEPATGLFGTVLGADYARGTFTRTLPSQADMLVAQSADSWVTVSSSGGALRWSRYRCNRDTQLFPGPATYTCGGTAYGGSGAALLSTAMSRTGRCLAVSTSAVTYFQVLENCDGALGVSPPSSCASNLTLPYGTSAFGRVTPFSALGEDSLLFAASEPSAGPDGYRLNRVPSASCQASSAWIETFSIPNVREYAPIQYGNKAGFLYVNTSNELRIHIP